MRIPATEAPSVGIREFRAALAEYIDAARPVTVTRHGQAVGLFVPLRRPSTDDVQHLLTNELQRTRGISRKQAWARMRQLAQELRCTRGSWPSPLPTCPGRAPGANGSPWRFA